ncbi:hypothetical protein BDR26DRAFT_858417 [Obelidium mucronatum]|nr:hypothetical protein BDR26DRAFT_858417 [Obelidium mucronatum]
MSDLEASDEFWGPASLVQSILSDKIPQPFPGTGSSNSPQKDSQQIEQDIDSILSTLSATSIRRSVDSLFTILYALFPHRTLEAIRSKFSADVSLSWSIDGNPNTIQLGAFGGTAAENTTYDVAWDPFHTAFSRLLELDILDEGFLVRQRVTNLIKAHRVHPVLVFATRDDELAMVQKGANRDAGEILVECLLLRCGNGCGLAPSASTAFGATPADEENAPDNTTTTAAAASNPTTASNLGINFDVGSVLLVNRMLRKSVLDHTASVRPPAKTHTSPMPLNSNDMMQHHLTLLLCELNYELSVRSAFMNQVVKQKQEKSVEILGLVDRENLYQKLRSQQQELVHLNTALDQLRSETATTRERYRKYEEELNKRLKVARDAAREAKEAQGFMAEQVSAKDLEIEELKKRLEVGNRRIHQLEQELHLIEPDLERLVDCEAALKALSHKIIQHELDSSSREALLKHIETLESRLHALEISLASSEKQVKGLQDHIRFEEQQQTLEKWKRLRKKMSCWMKLFQNKRK